MNKGIFLMMSVALFLLVPSEAKPVEEEALPDVIVEEPFPMPPESPQDGNRPGVYCKMACPEGYTLAAGGFMCKCVRNGPKPTANTVFDDVFE